jgi:hypothetical protein
MDKKARERVEIAQDALAWEKAGALIVDSAPHKEPYVDFGSSDEERRTIRKNLWNQSNKQARDVVIGKCNVCVLGGLLLAKAVRFNAVTASDILERSVTKLLDHFTAEQLNEIEAAFEGRSYPALNKIWAGDLFINHYWQKAMPSRSQRFRAIMENIIRNEGTFVRDDIRPPTDD